MILARILSFLLLVMAVFSFLMCPTVHTFGEDIKHDLLPKINTEELKEKTERKLNLNFCKLSPTNHSNLLHHTINLQEFIIHSSQYFIPHLSIMETIKLIL